MFDEFEIEKVVGYLLAFGIGSIITYFRKMRKDITFAHKKIRKIQNHLGLNEEGECQNQQKKTKN